MSEEIEIVNNTNRDLKIELVASTSITVRRGATERVGDALLRRIVISEP